MNQKDYKEIARIIGGCNKYRDKDGILYLDVEQLKEDLADYFEREATEIKDMLKEKDFLEEDERRFVKVISFNKKQFLRNCGVKN